MRHAESLAYDWWKDPPDSLGQQKNFLLTKEDLDKYVHVLAQLKAAIDTEGANAVRLVRALEGKKVMPYDRPPTPVTVASVLEFMNYIAREKLNTMQVLTASVVARRKQAEAEQAQLRG